MVSVFEGQLTRTWFTHIGEKKHTITLYHDTISGVRSALVDFVEVVGSNGSSSLLMDSKGHRIFFSVDNKPGYIEIKRSGWTGFEYSCILGDVPLKENTQQVASATAQAEETFTAHVETTLFTKDEENGGQLAWYVVCAKRQSDHATTKVHRRFKDFADMNSQVKQNFKGHHLRSSLPSLPEKVLKITTDHMDPAFIQDRKQKLDAFIRDLVMIPHVADMTCVKAFLGLVDQIREISYSFHLPKLGLTLAANMKNVQVSPAVVQSIQNPENCENVCVGDCVSRINGASVNGLNFNGVVAKIKSLPRPMILHFVQIIGAIADPLPPQSHVPPEFAPARSFAFPTAHGPLEGANVSKSTTVEVKPLPTFDEDDNVIIQDLGPTTNTLQSDPANTSLRPASGTIAATAATGKVSAAKANKMAASAFLDPDELDYLTTNVASASISRTNNNKGTAGASSSSSAVNSIVAEGNPNATAALLKTPVLLKQQEKASLFGDDNDTELDIGGDVFVSSGNATTHGHNNNSSYANESALIIDDHDDQLQGESGWEL